MEKIAECEKGFAKRIAQSTRETMCLAQKENNEMIPLEEEEAREDAQEGISKKGR